jgi:hypothetical protein
MGRLILRMPEPFVERVRRWMMCSTQSFSFYRVSNPSLQDRDCLFRNFMDKVMYISDELHAA